MELTYISHLASVYSHAGVEQAAYAYTLHSYTQLKPKYTHKPAHKDADIDLLTDLN